MFSVTVCHKNSAYLVTPLPSVSYEWLPSKYGQRALYIKMCERWDHMPPASPFPTSMVILLLRLDFEQQIGHYAILKR